jgi:hypothetical protein
LWLQSSPKQLNVSYIDQVIILNFEPAAKCGRNPLPLCNGLIWSEDYLHLQKTPKAFHFIDMDARLPHHIDRAPLSDLTIDPQSLTEEIPQDSGMVDREQGIL